MVHARCFLFPGCDRYLCHPETAQVSRAEAEKLLIQNPRRLKAEQEQLLREMDSKTLSEKDRKRFLQRIGKLLYGESDDEDYIDG